MRGGRRPLAALVDSGRFAMKTPFWITWVLLTTGALQAGVNRWTSNGPYGGLFSGFAFHPTIGNLIFATGGNSLYRSENGGTDWARITVGGEGGYPGNVVVRIHPSNAGLILAASSSVFASIDKGVTWRENSRPEFDEWDSFYDMEFDPSDPRVWYAVSYRNGVFKSTDTGLSWVRKNQGLTIEPVMPCCDIPQIEVSPADGKTLYVLLSSRKGYKSVDGGETWQYLPGFTLSEQENVLAIDPANPLTLYAGGWNGLFKSQNGGQTWTNLACGCAPVGLAIAPRGTQTLYVTPRSMKSTDGGQTWEAMGVATSATFGVAVHPKKPNLVFIGGVGQGVFRSSNSGKTWSEVNRGLDNLVVNHLASYPTTPVRMYAVTEGGGLLYESSNGGTSWDLGGLQQGSDPVDSVYDIQVHPENPLVIVAAIEDESSGSVAISADAGESWRFEAPIASPGQGWRIGLDPSDDKIIYVEGQHYSGSGPKWQLMKSTDQGDSWKAVGRGLPNRRVVIITIDPNDTDVIYVGTEDGKVYKSADGGAKWKNASNGLKGPGLGDISVDPSDSNTLYASSFQGIFQSVDGGKSWKRRAPFGGGFVTPDPGNPQTVLAGGWGGMYLSTDRGLNWSLFDPTGLPPCFVNDLLVDQANRDKFTIATSRGVFSYTRKVASGSPVIEQVIPASGKAGDIVTINGSGFGQLQSTSKVLFGSLDAGTAQSWSDTRIRIAVPVAVRTGPVTVAVGSKSSNPFEFIVLPATGKIEPTSGPAAGGTRVTILAPSSVTGSGFGVFFGSAVATDVRFVEPNIITCTSPPGSGTVQVRITTTLASTDVGSFTYQ